MNQRVFLIAALILFFPVLTFAGKPFLAVETGGHMAMIKDIMYTSDGRRLISVSDDKSIRIWDIGSGEMVRKIVGQIGPGDEGKIFAAALSKDDTLLAVGGWLGSYTGSKPRAEEGAFKIRLIDLCTGEITALLKGHTNVIHSLAFSPDGKRLISGSFDKTARIWDVKTGKTLHELAGHAERIYAVVFSPDNTKALTGSFDHTLKLWDTDQGRLIKTLTGHGDKVRSAAFTPDGRYLLSGSDDKSIGLWNGKTGAFIKVLATQNRSVDSLSISPDSSRVLTGCGTSSGSRKNNIFSIPSGTLLASFSKHNNSVCATAISPGGTTAATGGGNDQEIYLWDIDTGRVRQRMAGKGKLVWNVGFSKDGRSIAWGQTWGSRNLFSHGLLERSLQIRQNARVFKIEPGKALSGDAGYLRGIDSVGPWSIQTKTGYSHKTLEIRKNGALFHEITLGSTDGYRHCSLTLTPDGETLISGGGNGCLASYSPSTGRLRQRFTGHTGDVWGVAVSPDSRLLVSGSADQTIRLWEIKTGKLLLTLFHGTDNEWVAWTPEGYYTCSLNGDNYVGWHINRGEDKSALYYPASRFAKQFYSPEIVAQYLETGGDIDETVRLVNLDRPVRKRVKETVADISAMLPPAVFFQDPVGSYTRVQNDRIRIRAVAKSMNKEPLTDIWVLVNGRNVDTKRALTLNTNKKKLNSLRAEIDLTVPLSRTENRISVLASNRFTRSEPEILRVIREVQGTTPDPFKPNLYLLSIGVSDYKDSSLNLNVAHKDAGGIAEVFEKQAGRLYNKVNKRVLTDSRATKDAVLDGLDWILAESTQKDLAVIFVAGHGIKDDGNNFYFVPHDGKVDKLRRTGVKWFDFQDVLERLPSKVILMADTCHSGAITGKRRDAGDMTDALRELVNAESGIVVMTASTGKELSHERKEWGHGAFTKAIIEGLNGKANYDNNNTIDIKELDLFVTNRVKTLTHGAQHPTTEIPKTLPNFPVIYKR